MKVINLGLAAVTASGAFCAGAAQASTIHEEVFVIEAGATINGARSSVYTKPVATSNKTETLGGQYPDTVTADATQNANGYSSVEVNVSHGGYDATAAGGYLDKSTAEARAYRQIFLTNTGTTATSLGMFDFRISGVELEVFNGGGSITPEASVSFSAFVSGGDRYDAQMTLTGAYNDFQIQDAQGFGGTVQREECYMGTCLRGVVPVDVLTGSINIGILQPGETATIVTDLIVDITFDGTETGARAKAVDPNGGSYFSYSFGPTPSPVPLPAPAWMLISALAGLGALRRRNRA